MRLAALRGVLITRCLVCLFFAWQLAQGSPPSVADLAGVFSKFVLTDGVLAIVLAVGVRGAGWDGAISAIAALDGGMRLAAFLILYFAPGIPGFAVTLVVFAALLAVFGLFFGVLDILEARRLRRETGFEGLGAILGVAGLGTIALAVVQFFIQPSVVGYRNTFIAGVVLQALTMLAVVVFAQWTPRFRVART